MLKLVVLLNLLHFNWKAETEGVATVRKTISLSNISSDLFHAVKLSSEQPSLFRLECLIHEREALTVISWRAMLRWTLACHLTNWQLTRRRVITTTIALTFSVDLVNDLLKHFKIIFRSEPVNICLGYNQTNDLLFFSLLSHCLYASEVADQEFVPNNYQEGNNVMSINDNYFSNYAGCQHSDQLWAHKKSF